MSNPLSLTILAEESAEVIVEIMKGDRFGLDTPVPWHPESKYEKGSTPRSRLEDEIGDWLGTLDYARLSGLKLDWQKIDARRKAKVSKIIRIHGWPEVT